MITRALCVLGSLCVLALPVRSAGSAVTFTDVTAAAGIKFVHNNGAFGKKYLPETLGSGCAFVDVDGDGWQDLFFVNSKSWPGLPAEARSAKPGLPAEARSAKPGLPAEARSAKAGRAA